MIRKSMPSGYDPTGVQRLSLANKRGTRLRGDHAQIKRPDTPPAFRNAGGACQAFDQ